MADDRLVFWFGAGLSAASGMPLGYGLTAKWLDHHLPQGEAGQILDLFDRNGVLFEKTLPRLEKVIDDAIWTFGPECLRNLEFFRQCQPNAQHRALADHIIAHRLHAITTNFDTAVEDAQPGAIPVMSPSTGITADWGLIKLHGSMGEDLGTLGHSIANLQAGLHPELKRRVLELLDDPNNTIVFCGYSGADYFDIAPLFDERARAERPFAARVIWLHHTRVNEGEDPTHTDAGWTDDDWEEALTEGALDILKAFDPDRKEGRAGDTAALLCEMIPTPDFPDPKPVGDWREGWNDRFQPTDEGRALYAAKLYASFGMGRKSASFINLAALPTDRFDRRHELLFNAWQDMGLYEAELVMRGWALTALAPGYSAEFQERRLAVTLWLSRMVVAAGFLYLRLLWRYRTVARFDRSDRPQVLWIFAEAGLFAQAIINWLPSGRMARVGFFWLILPMRFMIGAALILFQRHAPRCA